MKSRFKDYLEDYLYFNGISKEEFSSMTQINRRTLDRIFDGSELGVDVIQAISIVTEIPVEYIINIETSYKEYTKFLNELTGQNKSIDEEYKRFKVKESASFYNITLRNSYDKTLSIMDYYRFLKLNGPNAFADYTEKHVYWKSKHSTSHLPLLWLRSCMNELQNITLTNSYDKDNLLELVNKVLELSKTNILNEQELTNLFSNYGVYLVIKDAMPGTKVRGAFKVLGTGEPAIFITKLHKRTADIYFSLLHELSHLKTDYVSAKRKCYISDGVDDANEDKIDLQAYNWIIPQKEYDELVNNLALRLFSTLESNKYSNALLIYRLARNGHIKEYEEIYQKYNPVIK